MPTPYSSSAPTRPFLAQVLFLDQLLHHLRRPNLRNNIGLPNLTHHTLKRLACNRQVRQKIRMPALAATLADVAGGRATHNRLIRIHDLADSIVGRGLCHLPDGAAMLVQSALETFQPELRDHRLMRRCGRAHDWAGSPLPLPAPRATRP